MALQVNEGAKNPYSQLKQRYAALQKVALQAQVHVEDIANVSFAGSMHV